MSAVEAEVLRRIDDKAIETLASLTAVQYDRVRAEKADELGIRLSTLDRQVAEVRHQRNGNASNLGIQDIEPCAEPVDLAVLLSDIHKVIRRFIVCQRETAIAAALWIAMTWFIREIQVCPLAVITSPEKRCGKTQLLSLLLRLCYRALTASNISSSALFRTIDAWEPTLLVDEADAFMKENEELRGILNAGHTRDTSYVIRAVGEDFTPTKFNVWGPKALAGIGKLSDTLMDRAITFELRRKLPKETVERLRHAEPGLFDHLASQLARAAESYKENVRSAKPVLPDTLNDRAQDNWEPLLAIADVAGGVWPKQARDAALKLSGVEATQSLGVELLADIRKVFATFSRISTVNLIEELCKDDESPWSTYNRGKPISPRQISTRLREFGITSNQTVRISDSKTAKGYTAEMFDDAFARYLSSTPLNSVTESHVAENITTHVTDTNLVTVTDLKSVTSKLQENAVCDLVTEKSPYAGRIGVVV